MVNNPQAYPCLDHDGFNLSMRDPGMTLRDWFAGQALAGYCANQQFMANGIKRGIEPDALVSQAAYEMADAMLAEREPDGDVND